MEVDSCGVKSISIGKSVKEFFSNKSKLKIYFKIGNIKKRTTSSLTQVANFFIEILNICQ